MGFIHLVIRLESSPADRILIAVFSRLLIPNQNAIHNPTRLATDLSSTGSA